MSRCMKMYTSDYTCPIRFPFESIPQQARRNGSLAKLKQALQNWMLVKLLAMKRFASG